MRAPVQRLIGMAAAAALFVDAYVHLHDDGLYDSVTGPTVSQGTLFRIEAAVAIAVGLLLLLWPRRLAFAVGFVVLASAFGAVVLYRYVDVGELGPLPNMYEPTWDVTGKVASALAEGIGAAVCAAGLFVAIRARRAAARPRRSSSPRAAVSGAPVG